jgi:hypothetical protein
MNEQSYYDAVASEIQRQQLNPGLWARALAEADGSDERARSLYIRFRVEELRNAPTERRTERSQEAWKSLGRVAAYAWVRLRKKLSRSI